MRSFLRLGRKTVYAMIKEGKIPGVKRFGRALRLHRATVRQWAIDERHTKRGRQA
ncbi:helix-turn-helix domain-containing protein [Chondromyces apiculatus]|uniref:helix-turn-helix domain-containing protein n=1 Tax=Chondromyces apiculatus TaxID=51 RepID=UPI0035208CCA